MKADIHFKSILQNTQNYNTFNKNDAHMVSVVSFDLTIGSDIHKDLQVELRQPFGTDFETEPLEVGRVTGYKGAWNHSTFSDLCEEYYRSLIGSSGSGICIEGCSNVVMTNNFVGIPREATMEISDQGGSTW